MLSFNVCNRTIATKTANKDKCLPMQNSLMSLNIDGNGTDVIYYQIRVILNLLQISLISFPVRYM